MDRWWVRVWPDFILLGVLTVCIVTDLKNRKIYNVVTFPALFIAWLGHWATGSWTALGMSLTGFFTGLLLLLVPYLLGGMGAGDVKLLALIGALKGTSFVVMTAFYMALIGGVLAVFVLMRRKTFRSMAYSCVMYLYGLKCGVKLPLHIPKDSVTATYPYGVAIAGGGIMVLLGKEWGIG
jgi:prepilin peptidase CpaA